VPRITLETPGCICRFSKFCISKWESATVRYVRIEIGTASGNLCPFTHLGAADNLAQPRVGGVAGPPYDVEVDNAGLLAVDGMVRAVEREVAQGGELGFDPVELKAVEWHVSEFAGGLNGPVPDTRIDLRG
jgi:hypothetical protein